MSIEIPLFRRLELNASFLAGGMDQTIVLPTINLVPFSCATLSVRVHEATWSPGAYFRMDGYASYPTPEDDREFIESSRISGVVSQSAALPAVGAGTDSNLPIAYKFIATLHQATLGGTLFVVASASLLLRPVSSRKYRVGKPQGPAANSGFNQVPVPPLSHATNCGPVGAAAIEQCAGFLAVCSQNGETDSGCVVSSSGNLLCDCFDPFDGWGDGSGN